MEKAISQASLAIIRKMQQNELTESVIYQEIAKFAKGEGNQQILLRLAREEHAHYEIWKKYTGIEMKPEKLTLEMATISVSVAVISFIVGILAKKFLGLDL